MTIPWIAWGQGVRPGSLDNPPVRTMDTAATVLWLLGVPRPGDWAGEPVTRAFDPNWQGDARDSRDQNVTTEATNSRRGGANALPVPKNGFGS